MGTLEDVFFTFVNSIAYQKINLIYGKYASKVEIKGVDEKMKPLTLAEPKLVFDKREMAGSPDNMYFHIEDGKIKMQYVLLAISTVSDAVPMTISELTATLHIRNENGNETSENLTVATLGSRPQTVSGYKEWKSIDEFVAVKNAIENENCNVYISWIGKVQWLDISSPEMQANLKKPEFKPQPQIATLNGTIPVNVVPDSASYTSMFGGVKSLMCWDYEILNEGKVFFKDPFQNDLLYFLPQEYRIKALDDNSPDMTIEWVSKDKILIRFGIGPYIHPNAEREAYDIFRRRKGKPYCKLEYGGYESAEFKWDEQIMKNGNLYGEKGFTSLTSQGEIKSAPDSNFFIVLEAPADGLFRLFHQQIMDKEREGIKIGDVYFTVLEGLDKKKIVLDPPIPVRLNLHKLVGIKAYVRITECEWPSYRARITNEGLYPIEIGALALSVLRRDNSGEVLDAKHYLKCTAEYSLPKKLARGETLMVELTSEEAKNIEHKKKKFLGFIGKDEPDKRYWTDFICEPYSIRLPDSTLQEVLDKTNESATIELSTWELKVIANFYWADYPGLTAVQVEITNLYGLDEEVTLTEGDDKQTIPMVSNLNAALKTQQDNEKKFGYRVKTIVKDKSSNSHWSDWTYESGNTLFIESHCLDLSN